MASPLAQIDWNNLESASLVTAMNLLELAYQERMNMVTLVGFGGTSRLRLPVDLYPFLNNSPQYGKDNWPMIWSNNTNYNDKLLQFYLSETKISAGLGTIAPNLFQGYNYRDYKQTEAQLFLDHGITEFPIFNVVTPAKIKKWYDIITSLKCILVEYAEGGAKSTSYRLSETYTEGIFRTTAASPFFGHRIRYDGINGPAFSQFSTDWAQLLSGPTVKQIYAHSVNGKLLSPMSCNFRFYSAADVGAYHTKNYTRTDNTDYAATGLTGVPESICYGSYGYQFSGGSTNYDPLVTNGEIIQMPVVTRTALAGNVIERSCDFSPLPIPAFDSPYIDFDFFTSASIYENWDVAGGFTFYTPD